MKRIRRRLLRHHLPLLVVCGASVAALYFTRPYTDVVSRLSFATAYPALVLLGLTLVTGPWNVLRRVRNPVSSDLRRDLGFWAAVLGVLHAVVGQTVHLRGRPWLYYVYDSRTGGPHGLRHDLFGLNNFSGLAGVLVLLVLFVTSNDLSLRYFGTSAWKKLQRWNFVCFGLSALHTLGYQVMEKQKKSFLVAAVFCVGFTVVMQGLGYFARRRESSLQGSEAGGLG